MGEKQRKRGIDDQEWGWKKDREKKRESGREEAGWIGPKGDISCFSMVV